MARGETGDAQAVSFHKDTRGQTLEVLEVIAVEELPPTAKGGEVGGPTLEVLGGAEEVDEEV